MNIVHIFLQEAIMSTRHKVLAIAALLITALGSSPLAAQISSFTSNANNATSGLFSTETDKFLDVNNWEEVEFDTFFTTFQVDTGGLGAGLAFKAGSVYLGFGYIGNLWSGNFNVKTDEYGDNYATPGLRGKNRVTNSGALKWTNQLSFLIGTAPIGGILLEANLSGLGKNNNDSDSFDAGGNKITNKNSVGLGSIEAGIGWGRNFEFGSGNVLKPNLGFNYNFDLQKTVTDPGTSGSIETTTLNGVDPFFSQKPGYSSINGGKVGLTGIIAAHAGVEVALPVYSIWAGYDFETHTYDKQISSSAAWTDYAPSYTGHLINAGVGGWYTFDRKLSFAWSLESDFGIENAAVSSVQTNGLPVPDHKFSDSLFAIYPKMAAGVVYKLLPDKFNFNASIALYPLDFTYRKFTHNDISGVMTNTTEKTSKISTAYTDTALGFTWFITSGFSFDTAVNITANKIKVDLTSFSALLSYKY